MMYLAHPFQGFIKSKVIKLCKIRQKQFAKTVTPLLLSFRSIYLFIIHHKRKSKIEKCPKGGQVDVAFQNQTA